MGKCGRARVRRAHGAMAGGAMASSLARPTGGRSRAHAQHERGVMAACARRDGGRTVKTGQPLLVKEVHPPNVSVSRPIVDADPLGAFSSQARDGRTKCRDVGRTPLGANRASDTCARRPKGRPPHIWPESASQSAELDENRCHWHRFSSRAR